MKTAVRLGFESQSKFAVVQLLSRNSVGNFFNRKPIQLDTFKRICEGLTLEWQDIAGMTEENINKESKENKTNLSSSAEVGVEPVKTLVRQITVSDELSQTIKAEIKLRGDVDSLQNIQLIASILRQYGGNTIKIIDIQEGSIKLIIEGSQEDIDRLLIKIESGELTQIDSFPIESTQILSKDSEYEGSIWEKPHLTEEITYNSFSELLGKLIREALYSPEKAEALALMIDHLPEIRRYLGESYLPYYYQALLLTERYVKRNIREFLQNYGLNLETLDSQNNSETARVGQHFISWVSIVLRQHCYDIHRRKALSIPIIDEIGDNTRGDAIADDALSALSDLLHEDKDLIEGEKKTIISWLKKYIQTDPHQILINCHLHERPEINCQVLLQLRFLEEPPLTLQEISERLQVPLQTIKSRLERNCIPIIREIISELGYD